MIAGDLSRMGQLSRNLGKLASVPSMASAKLSEKLPEVIDKQFQTGTDPYGRAWTPHADATIERHGEHPLLDLSGQMRSSLHVHPMQAAGVSVTIDHPSEDHQTGWKGPQGEGPARPILPMGTFPATWRAAVQDSIQESINEAMK